MERKCLKTLEVTSSLFVLHGPHIQVRYLCGPGRLQGGSSSLQYHHCQHLKRGQHGRYLWDLEQSPFCPWANQQSWPGPPPYHVWVAALTAMWWLTQAACSSGPFSQSWTDWRSRRLGLSGHCRWWPVPSLDSHLVSGEPDRCRFTGARTCHLHFEAKVAAVCQLILDQWHQFQVIFLSSFLHYFFDSLKPHCDFIIPVRVIEILNVILVGTALLRM